MAGDLNRVMLIGRLTRDPELKQTQGGTAYCKFGIANNRKYKTAQGEKKEEVSFFNATAWGKTAEVINTYCRRGKLVAIEGRLEQRSWQDQQGQKQSAVDVVVENLQMLGSPGEGQDDQPGGFGSGQGGNPSGGGGFDPGPMDDDDTIF